MSATRVCCIVCSLSAIFKIPRKLASPTRGIYLFMLSFYVNYHYIAIMANTIYTTLHRYLLHIGSHKAKIFSYGWQSCRPSFNMASGSDTIHNIALCITYIILQTLRHTLNKLFRISISYFVMIYAVRGRYVRAYYLYKGNHLLASPCPGWGQDGY